MGNKYTSWGTPGEYKDETYEVIDNKIIYNKEGRISEQSLTKSSKITDMYGNPYNGDGNKAIFHITTHDHSRKEPYFVFKNAYQFYNEVKYAILCAPEQIQEETSNPQTFKKEPESKPVPPPERSNPFTQTRTHSKKQSHSSFFNSISPLEDFEICIPAIPDIVYDLLKRILPQYNNPESLRTWYRYPRVNPGFYGLRRQIASRRSVNYST